jgi:hypothetical protein
MTDPNQPDAGNLFLVVSTADGQVHSTIRKESDATWSAFDLVSSPASGEGNVVDASAMIGWVLTVDGSAVRRMRYFSQDATGAWKPRFLASGLAPASALFTSHGQAYAAALGVGAPTLPGLSFGLPLMIALPTAIWLPGDQLRQMDTSALSPFDTVLTLDVVGGISGDGDEINYDIWLVAHSGELFWVRQSIFKGVPLSPPPRITNVRSFIGGFPGPVFSVGAAGGSVCVVDGHGTIWHALELSDGTWTGFGSVNAATGSVGTIFTQVAHTIFNGIGGANPQFHVVAVDNGGGLLHAIRHHDGTWTPFGNVKRATGIPPNPDIGNVTTLSIDARQWNIP